MGDPAFNSNVLDVLEELPLLYSAPGLLPTLSTIAPKGTDRFFERLGDIKEKIYKERNIESKKIIKVKRKGIVEQKNKKYVSMSGERSVRL